MQDCLSILRASVGNIKKNHNVHAKLMKHVCFLWNVDYDISLLQRILLAQGMECRIFFRAEFSHLLMNHIYFFNNKIIPLKLTR